MTKNNRTKAYYAEALEQILVGKPFEKIQVKDLCTYCQTTRTTFYYHFHDKYDLVAWIFNQDYSAVFCAPDADGTEQTATKLLERMYEKRDFYRKVFTDHSQNSIRNYIHAFNVENGIRVVRLTYHALPSAEQMYMIHHFSYGSTQVLMDWLMGKFTMTADELAHMQYRVMPDFLEIAYRHGFEKCISQKN
ncbi:MAG: TetR/AcrR family transcriptional regulator C-terminal domain-containing protein [Atopobiaceae bacterium]